ncbi:Phosphoribosylformylglycinamidine synthase 2 [Caloramator mitchellensis]|uniref:Phosphoribosylformylglycinamidine synthase subunit PurL n=1 Tax=Caloramator mitchellensis TaxID=908809 RepID=A0A0R3K027_CALMK|nr:phosphoribosylformylglycinamidine synthase subunit PurL [Caloramator mitchellensis]KRQ86245.1 Phosphoribosylformylglycinamidine synthase 2 [Caloramator mitchellensis]
MLTYKDVGLNKEEYDLIVEKLGRVPNDLEISMLGVMWSEHCSYKNSRALLKLFNTKSQRVLQGPGENAGVVDIGDGYAIAMKIESHNHPSAIEPYQGAATGVGGILRDVFTMGARPIANLNSIRFGEIDSDKTKHLLKGVVKGIGDYGNSVGIPTVGGETVFNSCYDDNPLVNAMSVGLLKKEELKKGAAKGIGNPVMLVGHTTGRDGMGGASFASCDLTQESEEKRSAVQVGDPFMEKLLLEACLELIKEGCVVGIQDLGAAGLTSASCETAFRGGSGIKIDVTNVITREKGMNPIEIMISESQERMLAIVEKGKENKVFEIFSKWGLHASIIGEVTDDGFVSIFEGEKLVGQLPAYLLADGAPANLRPFKRPKYMDKLNRFDTSTLKKQENLKEALLKMLKSPNIASKSWVYRQYDHQVRNSTVVKPGGDAGLVLIDGKKAIALTTDCNARYCYLNPYEGAKISVLEAARNIASTGATPIAITDCLNFASPENEEIYYQFRNSILGINEASRILNTPVISGNVSFYNQSEKTAIYPTPVIGMLGLLEDANKHTTIHFKEEGDAIILVGETKDEIGGSEYLKVVYGVEAGRVPEAHTEIEKNTIEGVIKCIDKGLVKSCHDISDGGFIVALLECCFKNSLGAKINIETELEDDRFLFSESQGRFIISCQEKNVDEIILNFKKLGIMAKKIGKVEKDIVSVSFNGKESLNVAVTEAKNEWESGLICLME